MTTSTPQEQMRTLITHAQKILVVGPHNWQGDSVCGVVGLQIFLSRLGKDVVAASPSSVPGRFQFLTGTDHIVHDLGQGGDFVISISTKDADVDRVKYTINDDSVDIIVSPASGGFSPQDVSFIQDSAQFDLIIVVGSENLENLGTMFTDQPSLFDRSSVINLSVSPGNEHFGTVNMVDPAKASTCEMIAEMLTSENTWQQHLDADLSTVLLAGILSATSSFQGRGTSSGSLTMAGMLQSHGARQSDVIEHLFKMRTFPTLKSWGRAFGNLELDQAHNLTWASIGRSDFELAGATPGDVETLADDIIRFVKGADIAALFLENKEGVQVQLRSSSHIDWKLLMTNWADIHMEKNGSGIDCAFANKTLVEVQYLVLQSLVQFQKQRLNIPPEVEMDRVILQPVEPEMPEMFPLDAAGSETSVQPKMPTNVPFESEE